MECHGEKDLCGRTWGRVYVLYHPPAPPSPLTGRKAPQFNGTTLKIKLRAEGHSFFVVRFDASRSNRRVEFGLDVIQQKARVRRR